MKKLTRRDFLAVAGAGLSANALAAQADSEHEAAFFLIGDTHYLANRERPTELDGQSGTATSRLVDWLNRLPGTALPENIGGGTLPMPNGVIHAGDVIDSGDKNGAVFQAMQQTEWRSFVADFGLNGRDGRLRLPVYEVHGNHDSPRGTGLVIDGICERNRQRPGVVNTSANGLHYSWDWGPVHFIDLGIVVGSVGATARQRRYAPLDSLPFLIADLERFCRERSRPVIITHHVDVARYSGDCNEQQPSTNQEWDPCDVRGYYDAIRNYNVLAILYGHTHARNVFRWNGTRTAVAEGGIPVFNTDNVSHFNSDAQAFFHCTIQRRELVMREFATRDAWQTGNWTPMVWRIARN